MREPGRFLTVAQTVSLTGLSERTIREFLAKGRLPAIRPPGVRIVRIPEAAVIDFMQGGTPERTEPKTHEAGR